MYERLEIQDSTLERMMAFQAPFRTGIRRIESLDLFDRWPVVSYSPIVSVQLDNRNNIVKIRGLSYLDLFKRREREHTILLQFL
jgi:hypothetical protein